jgi:hypothetical protein
MRSKSLFAAASLTAVGLVALAGVIAIAEDKSPAGKPELKLPPGFTAADMEACQKAATPGKMHARLASDAGVWQGKNKMWLSPESEPVATESTTKITALFGGRFIQQEIAGEMPGMGPYNGLAISGFDNVSQKFVSTWIDNCGTGLANGEGDLSSDGKVLTWRFTYNCPIQKKPVVMRQIETTTGPDTKTVELFTANPKTGKEYKMMHIELSRKK